MKDPYWALWKADSQGNVEWYAGKRGDYGDDWSPSWVKRERFGSRSHAMSVLWDLRHRRGGKMSVVKVVQKTRTSAS